MTESCGCAPQWLSGKKGLVLGIANDKSIAWGCAKAFRAMGAELAVTYLNEKSRTYVEPLAKQVDAPIFMPCDVQQPEALDAVFDAIKEQWGKLDFILHSIAFAPMADLHGRVTDCSKDGFLQAMDISCHSFIRMAKLAEPLMTEGGTMLTMSYYGAEKVVKDYNMMGPVKAALEATTRYMAYELGEKNIRVHAISPGPIMTRAASGIKDFKNMLDDKSKMAPLRRLSSVEDVGWAAAFLVTEQASALSGLTLYVDGGVHVMG